MDKKSTAYKQARQELDAAYEKAGWKQVKQNLASENHMYMYNDWYNPRKESEEEARKRFFNQHNAEIGNSEFVPKSMNMIKENSATPADFQTSMATEMANWESRMPQSSEQEKREMISALPELAKMDKNGLASNYIVHNMLLGAALEGDKNRRIEALNGMEKIIDNTQSDRQMAAIIGGLSHSSYLESDENSGIKGATDMFLNRCMNNKNFGPQAMSAMSAALFNNNINDEDRSKLFDTLSKRFEQNKENMPEHFRNRISSSLGRFSQRQNTQQQQSQRSQESLNPRPAQPTPQPRSGNPRETLPSPSRSFGQRVGDKIGKGIDKTISAGKKVGKAAKFAGKAALYTAAAPLYVSYKAAQLGYKAGKKVLSLVEQALKSSGNSGGTPHPTPSPSQNQQDPGQLHAIPEQENQQEQTKTPKKNKKKLGKHLWDLMNGSNSNLEYRGIKSEEMTPEMRERAQNMRHSPVVINFRNSGGR
ncbi:MAG: hypothetical protein Q4F75_07230 [Pseudomonadota bacterium]|nr:hypothetical protein [Pseudomonadota bacterium]